MELVEPDTLCVAGATVFIGKDRDGNWVAQELNGTFGGTFLNRAQAFKYALFENGHHPERIVEVSYEVELAISRGSTDRCQEV